MLVRHAFLMLLAGAALSAASAQSSTAADDRELRHQSAEWLLIEPHLPNPDTASADDLTTAADILRARRMPEDALDYYRFALNRGGDQAPLMNRIGVTELELRRPTAAEAAFRVVLALDKRNAEAWNNLGAASYMLGDTRAALGDYRKAVKLNNAAAVFHSNLGIALFERKDFEGARQQFNKALTLDPLLLQHASGAGIQAHILSSSQRGRFCFEMARLAASNHDDAAALLWLARASEAGFDVKYELTQARELLPYAHDPRVELLLANTKALRAGQIAQGSVPALPADNTLRE